MHIGVNEVAYPIDIFSVAHKLSSHIDAKLNFHQLLELAKDKENYFTRWAGVRAISQMGVIAISEAESTLRAQLSLETYDLAKKEILDALGQLESNAT